MLRIVFMGAPDFAVPSLRRLAQTEHEIVSVVSHPDKRRGRGSKRQPTPVKACALELGLPVLDAVSLDDPTLREQLANLKADLFVVVAFRILPESLLSIPTKGSVNLHASLLPLYRGAAPIHWAIMRGEEKTGCTVFFLKPDVDTGDIIGTVETPVGLNETTGDLYDRLKQMGAELLVDAIDRIDRGTVVSHAQDEMRATSAPKLFKEDGELNFNNPAAKVHNRIRGLSPFPGAWTTYNGNRLSVYRSGIGSAKDLEPGEMKLSEGKLFVGCEPGSLELLEVQLPGKQRMSGVDFANGYDISIGLG